MHQSAKDFLLAEAAKEVFPSGVEVVHHAIFARSLKTMSRTLQRDIYSLKEIGYAIDDVKQPDPDPLAARKVPSSSSSSMRTQTDPRGEHLGNSLWPSEYILSLVHIPFCGADRRFQTLSFLLASSSRFSYATRLQAGMVNGCSF